MDVRSKWLGALLLGGSLGGAPAVAQAEVETWFGAVAEVTGGYVDFDDEGTALSGTQIEGAFLLTAGRLTIDVQLDVFLDTVEGEVIEQPPADWAATRYVRPEYAQVELDLDGPFIRGGVVNTGFGLEDWDLWNNRLPTYSNFYEMLSPGRLLGGEVGLAFGDANEITLHGGYDLDWEAARTGFAVGYETETWSTWSGVAAYPSIDLYHLILGGEIMAHELLTIAYDGSAGVSDGSPFVVADLTFVAMPDAMIAPALRVEGTIDPDGATETPDASVGLGATAWPLEWLRVAVEVNADFAGDEVVPGVFGALSLHTPGPPEDEEAGGDEGPEEVGPDTEPGGQ